MWASSLSFEADSAGYFAVEKSGICAFKRNKLVYGFIYKNKAKSKRLLGSKCLVFVGKPRGV